ncbi:High mobility group protein DSP1 [Orchesella cincta]|uniref:High mobility group protein DSP1 n=1 Tax=Orchesella cincta TaxID=48709 RepID=A0A1D2MAQ5_ORCCI|nr:High mobility group protein DSP1 [Orchesella cincta]
MERLLHQQTKALGQYATPLRNVVSLNFTFNKGDTEKILFGQRDQVISFWFCFAAGCVHFLVNIRLVRSHSSAFTGNQRSSLVSVDLVVGVGTKMSGQTRGVAGGSSKKPKGPVSAYAYFVKICREQWKREGSEKLSFADHSKTCAELWKEMSASQKMPFVELQMKDKTRYQKEMRSYGLEPSPPKGQGQEDEKAKDPDAPKRGLSAFFWFSHDERAKVKGANPGGQGSRRMWGGMNDADKSKYQTMAAQDKARYQKEMEEYKRLAESRAAAATQLEEDDDDDDEEGEDEQDYEDDDEEMC